MARPQGRHLDHDFVRKGWVGVGIEAARFWTAATPTEVAAPSAIQGQLTGTGLAAKNQGTWYKDIIFNDIGYYRSDRPFKVTVDWGNKVAESNETDNTKSIVLD